MKTFVTTLVLLAASASGNAAPPPWGQVILHDSFEDIKTCPVKITVPDGTTRTRLSLSNITYGVFPGTRPSVALTEWDNVWGHNSPNDGVTTWPGVTGAAPSLKDFSRTSYVALHFKTPATVPPGSAGRFVNPTAMGGPNTTMAFSTQCGDFSMHLPTPGCIALNIPTGDYSMIYWKFTATSPNATCNLQPDTDYYVNIIQSDTDSHVECAGSTCPVSPWRGG
jgi:hypothetical protein